MAPFDYTAPAELFPSRGRGRRGSAVSYKRFDTAADAIRFAMEDLAPALLSGAILEVDEARFDDVAIRDLYTSDDYPLKRGTTTNGESL
jgi:hypothetical protein